MKTTILLAVRRKSGKNLRKNPPIITVLRKVRRKSGKPEKGVQTSKPAMRGNLRNDRFLKRKKGLHVETRRKSVNQRFRPKLKIRVKTKVGLRMAIKLRRKEVLCRKRSQRKANVRLEKGLFLRLQEEKVRPRLEPRLRLCPPKKRKRNNRVRRKRNNLKNSNITLMPNLITDDGQNI